MKYFLFFQETGCSLQSRSYLLQEHLSTHRCECCLSPLSPKGDLGPMCWPDSKERPSPSLGQDGRVTSRWEERGEAWSSPAWDGYMAPSVWVFGSHHDELLFLPHSTLLFLVSGSFTCSLITTALILYHSPWEIFFISSVLFNPHSS